MSQPAITVAELCDRIRVQPPATIAGVAIAGVTTLELVGENEASFVLKPRYLKVAAKSKAAVVLVPEGMKTDDPRALPVPDVWMAVLALLEHFHPAPRSSGTVHDSAVVDASARIGANVEIGPCAVIGKDARIGDNTIVDAHAVIERNVSIGADCQILANAVVRHGTRMGDRVIVHAGAVIGDDGFKYELAGGRLRKVPQVGIVVIEDDVEIGANTTIDRAGFHETRIGARSKIDNLVHIAHNVVVGSDSIIVAQVGVAGSTKIGRGVMIGGQTGIKDNISIGDGARIAARSGISSSVGPGAEMMGYPAMPMNEYLRSLKALKRLPAVMEEVLPLVREMKRQREESDEDGDW